MEFRDHNELIVHNTIWVRNKQGILFTVVEGDHLQKENGWKIHVGHIIKALFSVLNEIRVVCNHHLYCIDECDGSIRVSENISMLCYFINDKWEVISSSDHMGSMLIVRNIHTDHRTRYVLDYSVEAIDVQGSHLAMACINGDVFMFDLTHSRIITTMRNVALHSFFRSIIIFPRFPHLVLGNDVMNNIFVIDTYRERTRWLTGRFHFTKQQFLAIQPHSFQINILWNDTISKLCFCPTESSKIKSMCAGHKSKKIFFIVLERLISGDDFI